MIVTFKREFQFPSFFYKCTMVPNIYTIITIVYIQWLPLYTCRHQSCKGETRSSTVLKLCSRYYLHGNIVHWIKSHNWKPSKHHKRQLAQHLNTRPTVGWSSLIIFLPDQRECRFHHPGFLLVKSELKIVPLK